MIIVLIGPGTLYKKADMSIDNLIGTILKGQDEVRIRVGVWVWVWVRLMIWVHGLGVRFGEPLKAEIEWS